MIDDLRTTEDDLRGMIMRLHVDVMSRYTMEGCTIGDWTVMCLRYAWKWPEMRPLINDIRLRFGLEKR